MEVLVRASHQSLIIGRGGLLALSLTIPFLAGCGGGSSSVNTPAIPTPTALTASAVTANGLTGTLSQAAVTVPMSGNIQYTISLTNTTSQPVVINEVYYSDQTARGGQIPGPSAFFEVKDPAGARLYPGPVVALGAPFQTVDVTLQPGQVVTRSVQVSGFKAKGLYTANASFPNGPGQPADAGPLSVLAQ